MIKTIRRFGVAGLIVSLLIADGLSAAAQGLLQRRTLGSRVARPAACAVQGREACSARQNEATKTEFYFKDICFRSLLGINDEVLADSDRFPCAQDWVPPIELGERFGGFTNATMTVTKDRNTGKLALSDVKFIKVLGPEADDKALLKEYEHAVDLVSKLLGVSVTCSGLVDPATYLRRRYAIDRRIKSRTLLNLAKGQRVEIEATEASYVIRAGQPIQTTAPIVEIKFAYSGQFGVRRSSGQDSEFVKELTLGMDCSDLLGMKMRVQQEQSKLRELERTVQRQQLAAIQEELKRVREARAAAAKSDCAVNSSTNKPSSEKISVAEKLSQCDFLLNKDFKKDAKFYLCLFSASWCPPCRAEMPRIAKTYAETLKDDPDIELVHFSRDQNDDKANAWAKEHDVKFPVVKPRGGNPLDLHCNGIPHLFIVKADGTLLEEGHPMRIFNEEKFREIKGASTTGAREPDADTCDVVSSDDMTGPYGIRMQPDPGCEKGALYVLKRLKDVYLPAAVRYYGDPFVGQKPTRVFTLHVKRNDGTGKRKYTGVSWGSCGDGIDSFTIGLAKGSDKWEMDLPLVASKILTVCSESDGAAFSIYANKFVRGEVDHCDPIPKIKEDIREGLRLRGEAEDKVKGRPWGLRKLAPTWAAFEELREKHPTLVLDYCNLKNSKYAKGELRQEISEDQMMALMSEVAGVDAAAIFKKHSAASISSTPQGKISVAEKLGQCDFLLNKDFKKKAKFYLCLFSASWCGPCRREMPRIAKAYAETLKDDPDIELIHFSRDQNDEKALAWAKEHDVKFPVVKPRGGNPLDLHCNGIPHLFIVKADGTLVEEGHPMRIFNEEKFREIRGKLKNLAVKEEANTSMNIAASMETKASDVKWTYELFNGAIRLGVGCRGNALKSPSDVFGELVIPAEIEGVPVRYIGANAFHSRNFTSVTIPSSVREIDYSAFIWCKRLKSVTISSGLTTLGRFSPFGYCQELKSFCVDPDNPSFCSRDGLLCSKDGATLVAGVNGNVTIPMGVTRISDEAFYGCLALKSVSIPSCVTDIGRAAFLSCRALKSVTVPHSVSSIGEQAFGWCSELTNIVVETSNVSYSSENGVLYNKAKTELLCWPAGRSGAGVIPSSVASIGRSAFSRCEGLTSLTMPKNVKRIGNGAFENCRTLTTVVLHGECPDSPDNIFNGCKNLNSIHVPANAKSWAGMKHWKGIPLVFDAETKK